MTQPAIHATHAPDSAPAATARPRGPAAARWRWDPDRALLSGGTDRAASYWAKRVLDVALATALLALLAPLMGLIALLVRLDTPGPVLFVQQRAGARRRRRHGRAVWEVRTFPFCKFRSMVHGADSTLHQQYIRAFVRGESPAGGDFKLADDPRVTPVGRLLRRSSLDELPQLLNVLVGHMSLVGPRPVPPYEVAEYQHRHYERLAALPGITGLWQTRGRCQVPFEEMVRMDVDYVHRRSLWLDMGLLLLTVPAVLSGRGAR